MITVHKSDQRGHANHGWLDSYHSFSFADYFDPAHMQFGALRVINEDIIAPSRGFGMHGHRDMEIITYMLDGALEHRDSMGNGSIIRPGDVQRMSAGSGVRHSEQNPSADKAAHLLQIWIIPARSGGAPGYEERRFDAAEKRGKLRLIASGDPQADAVGVQQDVALYAGLFDGAEQATHRLEPGRRAYVHVARGNADIAGQSLSAGDAVMVEGETAITIRGGRQAEILLFDLA